MAITAAVTRAVRTALVLGPVFALVDLWQVALRNPASLSATNVIALVLLYVAAAAAAGMIVFLVFRRAELARALLVCVGSFFLAEEVSLRALPPLSPWRPWAVLALAAVAAAALVPVARLVRARRVPRAMAALGALLLVVGGVGAVRGFGRGGGEHGGGAVDDEAARRPNLLLITIDTLRADHLGCYGYERPTSPVLDTFAREGVLFRRAYAQSSWTKPSTASLLTSHYPSMHQATLERSKLSDAETLLPEVLRDHGYTTAVLSGNPWVTAEYGFDQGVDWFYSIYDERFARVTLFMTTLKRVNKWVQSNPRGYNLVKRLVQGELSTTARDEHLAGEAEKWLARGRDRPFFLYMHLMSPHHPYDPPPPFDRIFTRAPVDAPVTVYPRKSYYFYEQGDPLPDAQRADMIGRYDGDILFADGVLGRLLATLRRLDLLDHTVVVVTADHGEEFYDHANWGHGHSLYDELLHVPLVMRYPAGLPAGKRIDEVVMAVDVMPTLLALAGVPPPPTLAGRSLVGLAAGHGLGAPVEAYSELLYRYGNGWTLVRDDRKLLETSVGDDRRQSLFDLAADPRETRNLLDGQRDGVAPWARRLAELRTWAESHRVDAGEVHISDEMDRRLKALGYVN
jgi:arylsulfatase A-like enzyme